MVFMKNNKFYLNKKLFIKKINETDKIRNLLTYFINKNN